MKKLIALTVAAATTLLVATGAQATTATLVSNGTLIDNAPFYSIGNEDQVGSNNYALNSQSFIDIPYAIFDLGSTVAVSSATLTWNFQSLFGSSPASISLYAGSDANGIITTADRNMGTVVDTTIYSGPTSKSVDVTSFVNAALASNSSFAVRLEANKAPSQISGYYGGLFGTPTLSFVAAPVPEPATWATMIGGLALVGAMMRRRAARVTFA